MQGRSVQDLNYIEFRGLIKKDKLENSYLFIGEEDYLMNECVSILKNKYVQSSLEDLNYTVLDGDNVTFDVLINACETLPFMSDKKIIILKNVNHFITKEETNLKDEIYKYLDSLGNHICLILMDDYNELKKNTKMYRFFNKKNCVVEFAKLKGKDLNLWVEKELKLYDKKMSFSNINYFLQNSSYLSKNTHSKLYDLENELKKLIDFTKGSEINKVDIDLLMIKPLDNNIFDLLSALNTGDINTSLQIFNEIYLSNEPIQKILFMITRQLRLLLNYKLYKDKRCNDGYIQGKLQIKSYEFGKIASSSKNYEIEDLENSLNLILEVDRRIKTTSVNDKIEMEMLLVKLAKKK